MKFPESSAFGMPSKVGSGDTPPPSPSRKKREKEYQRNYITKREWVANGTWRDTWFQVENGKEVYYEQRFGLNPSRPRKIRGKKDILNLIWYFERYLPDGTRI